MSVFLGRYTKYNNSRQIFIQVITAFHNIIDYAKVSAALLIYVLDCIVTISNPTQHFDDTTGNILNYFGDVYVSQNLVLCKYLTKRKLHKGNFGDGKFDKPFIDSIITNSLKYYFDI